MVTKTKTVHPVPRSRTALKKEYRQMLQKFKRYVRRYKNASVPYRLHDQFPQKTDSGNHSA